MTTEIILCCMAIASGLAGLGCELARDLMMYQQNSYRNERYGRWLRESGDSTSMWRLTGLVIFFIALSTLSHIYVSTVLETIFMAALAVTLSRRHYKKPLAWTARVRRLYTASWLVTAVIIVPAVLLTGTSSAGTVLYTTAVTLLGCYCASHGIVMSAGLLLQPLEKSINRRYCNDARRRLQSMPDLRVIGITGSYGKTSTKHYLYRLLSEQYDTLMTPGSYNTTLGVVRTIREQLKPYNEIFIVEMGAKQPGDIKEICDLVHPSTGIITAVGPQHLESFKTIERGQATKFELVDALPPDGLAIVNNDFEKIADRPVDNVKCLRYGVNNPTADLEAVDVRYSARGTSFTVRSRDGRQLQLTTRLMGEHNISDLLAAIAAARAMGVTDSRIAAGVASIEPVEHRLSVKKTPGGITILDDAFNSNPVGSRMAMEVLGAMGPGKRIVITPGMVELGERRHELNADLGRAIDANADVAIIVGHYNRDALLEGIAAGGRLGADAIHAVETFNDAQTLLSTIVSTGDVVLYENDLPDTFK